MSPRDRPKTVLISFAPHNASLGVNLLSSVLKKNGFAVSMIFFPPIRERYFQRIEPYSRQDYRALVDKCTELDADVVGISVLSAFYKAAETITGMLRHGRKRLIVWGGVHPTLEPARCLEHADVICRGEGEKAIVDLLCAVENGGTAEEITNLSIRKNGGITGNSVVQIEDLNSLPFPDLDTEDKYTLREGRLVPASGGYASYFLSTSRGCHYACNYCANQALRRVYGRYRVRRRGVENVISEMQNAITVNPQLRRVFIGDDIFTFDIAWIRMFGGLYAREIGLPFKCFCHPDFVSQDMLDGIKAAGCTRLSMGIQGCSQRMRREFNRMTPDDKLLKACELIVGSRFAEFNVDIILSPFDTMDDRREGLDFLLRIPKPFSTNINNLVFLPGTRMSELGVAKGMIAIKDVQEGRAGDFKEYGRAMRGPDSVWWHLYSLCGKKHVPSFVVRLGSKLPIVASILFVMCRIVDMFRRREWE